MKITAKEHGVADIFKYIISTVTPRPIALVSTTNSNGDVNLSPFSFFNAFSANPPILIFSPSRRVRDNTTKHTLENVIEHPECVIHLVNFDIVEQMSLSSTEYDKGVNEFKKAGFTALKSDLVSAPRIKEAPVAFECKVIEVKALGDQGGAGNLVICEVLTIHIDDTILDQQGNVDSLKLDIVSRLGGNWYSRTVPEALFEISKPLQSKGIGIDQLPEAIRKSTILTGNDLARLGNVEKLPSKEEITLLEGIAIIKNTDELHKQAKELLLLDKTQKALELLLYNLFMG